VNNIIIEALIKYFPLSAGSRSNLRLEGREGRFSKVSMREEENGQICGGCGSRDDQYPVYDL
jgi:hypothetical protein